MNYTISELAKMSGVSVRTLRWYDEIGLLKPFIKGANNYRYYKEEQLLRLQQILFFKELGFSLNDIHKLLSQNNFDNIKSLQEHRKILLDSIDHKNNLIAKINKTIQPLKGKRFIPEEVLYHGLDSDRQKEYEQYMMQYKDIAAKSLLIQSKKRKTNWDRGEWDNIKNEGEAIYKSLASAIESGANPEAEEVQNIIKQHCDMMKEIYDVSKELYIGLTDLYVQHPDFKKFFDAYHPRMAFFIGEAMRYYAHKNL